MPPFFLFSRLLIHNLVALRQQTFSYSLIPPKKLFCGILLPFAAYEELWVKESAFSHEISSVDPASVLVALCPQQKTTTHLNRVGSHSLRERDITGITTVLKARREGYWQGSGWLVSALYNHWRHLHWWWKKKIYYNLLCKTWSGKWPYTLMGEKDYWRVIKCVNFPCSKGRKRNEAPEQMVLHWWSFAVVQSSLEPSLTSFEMWPYISCTHKTSAETDSHTWAMVF